MRTPRSEEHTSELQSLRHLVCRLLLEKKKKTHRHSLTPRITTIPDAPPPLTSARHDSERGAGRGGWRGPACGRSYCVVFFFLNKRAPPKFSPFPLPALFRF